MSRLRDWLVLAGVACAVPGSALGLGQVQKVAAPLPAAVQPVPPPEKKQVAPVRPDATEKTRKVEARPAAKAKPAMKAAVVRPARVIAKQAPAVLDAQAAQYVQQFRPMFRAEYYFIRNSCGLNADQRRQLARMGEAMVKTAARQFVEAQQKMMVRGWQQGVEYPDPRKLIEQQLSQEVVGFLSQEQALRYKAELEKRTASRKQVAIDNLVAKLDGDLVLTSEQRSKLVNALATNWKDSWCQSLEMLQNIDSFFPSIPDQVVTPLLTENQKQVWRGIPKNQNVYFGLMFGGMVMENDPLDDPELVDARKEAEAREKK